MLSKLHSTPREPRVPPVTPGTLTKYNRQPQHCKETRTMGIAERQPLMAMDEFLAEVEFIQQTIATYNENLDKINNSLHKLLRDSLSREDKESLSSELEQLRTKNKDIRKLIAEVRYHCIRIDY